MDPASATGLAAAILQLATYTGKVLTRSIEIYERADGALLRHSELSEITKCFHDRLSELTPAQAPDEGVGDASDGPGKTEESGRGKTQLEQLACQAQCVTQELLDLLQELSTKSGPKLGWRSVRQAVLTVWKESELRDLEDRVARYRSQIDSVLLHDLSGYVAQRQDEQRKQSKRISNYADIVTPDSTQGNRTARKVLKDCLKDRPHSLEVPQDFASNILASVAEDDRVKRDLAVRNHLMSALDFQELTTRHETIPEAYTRTFEWVYQRPERGPFKYEWSNFTTWLHSNDDLYWIAGKPGAGKSTLMKYLYDNEKTLEFVRSWSKTQPVNKAGFFFWNSGTDMQMSRTGFARSLLTQLCNRPAEMAKAFPRRWQRCELLGWSKEPFTWEELMFALDKRLSHPDEKFLLFIDGLDEFEGDKDELLDVVFRLSAKQNVKICTASRPWVEFVSRFHGVPQLLIENLTRHDIVTYVEGRFSSSREFAAMRIYEAEGAQRLTNGIIEKAAGVFLWVYVVVSMLLQGCRDGDHIKALLEKLDSLPAELDEMFDKILQQVAPAHEQEASELFQFVRAQPKQSTLISLYWSRLTLEEVADAEIREFSNEEAKYHAEKMRRNLLSRCKCLLDVPAHLDLAPAVQVTWLHRTAREYCEQGNVWAKIRSQSPHYDPAKALTLSILRQARASTTSTGHTWNDVHRSLSQAIHRRRTLSSMEEQSLFLDQVEHTGATLYARQLQSWEDRTYERHWLQSKSVHTDEKNTFGLTGNTTVFYLAVVYEWDWYVKHRLALDPESIHVPLSSTDNSDAVQFTIRAGMWDILHLCLRDGCDASCTNYCGTAWAEFLKTAEFRIRRRGISGAFPWDKLLQCAVAFLEYGADPVLTSGDLNAKIILESLLDLTRATARPSDVETIKNYLKKPKGTRRAVKTSSSNGQGKAAYIDRSTIHGTNGVPDVQASVTDALEGLQLAGSSHDLAVQPMAKDEEAPRRRRDRFFSWR